MWALILRLAFPFLLRARTPIPFFSASPKHQAILFLSSNCVTGLAAPANLQHIHCLLDATLARASLDLVHIPTNTRNHLLPLPTTRLTSTSTEIQLFTTARICYLENPKPATSAVPTPHVNSTHTAFLQPFPPFERSKRTDSELPFASPHTLTTTSLLRVECRTCLGRPSTHLIRMTNLQICLSQRTFTLMAPEGQAVTISSVLESSSQTTQLFQVL
jgi:hypothetical protein